LDHIVLRWYCADHFTGTTDETGDDGNYVIVGYQGYCYASPVAGSGEQLRGLWTAKVSSFIALCALLPSAVALNQYFEVLNGGAFQDNYLFTSQPSGYNYVRTECYALPASSNAPNTVALYDYVGPGSPAEHYILAANSVGEIGAALSNGYTTVG
jgi:hypothetical protein